MHMWQCICLVSYVSLRQQIPAKIQPSALGHENALLNNIENISPLIAQSLVSMHIFLLEKKCHLLFVQQCLVHNSTWYTASPCWVSE